MTVSHWLGCCQARRNSSFLLLGSNVTFFLLELQRYISSSWVCNWFPVVQHESSPFWTSSFSMRLLFTGKPHFIVLHFILLCTYCVFYKLKVCGNPELSKSIISAIFPTTFAHFLSLCHLLAILKLFQTFSLLSYLLWWSVISDLWSLMLLQWLAEGSDDS